MVQAYPSNLPMRTRFCGKCGAMLPLGPSDEHASAAVELEIRAAELVSVVAADTGEWWNGLVSLGMCSPGAEHVDALNANIKAGLMYERDLVNYYAGHLARCIHDHPEEP